MNKAVFLNSLSKQYVNLQIKVRQNYKILDWLKIIITFLIFFLTIGIYGYFVNVSSTKWYFLRQEMKNLEDAKFTHSISQIEVLKKEKSLWDNIETNIAMKQKKIKIDEKVVYVSYKKQMAVNKN